MSKEDILDLLFSSRKNQSKREEKNWALQEFEFEALKNNETNFNSRSDESQLDEFQNFEKTWLDSEKRDGAFEFDIDNHYQGLEISIDEGKTWSLGDQLQDSLDMNLLDIDLDKI